MTTIPLASGPPKRRIIEMAYGKCGLAGYELGRTPEELNDAASELDAMMLEWPFSLLGYAQPTYGVSNGDEQSGIPPDTLAAVATQLAVRLAPNMGKTLSPEAQRGVARSMALLYAHPMVTQIPTQPFQAHTPRGMGNKGFRQFINPFIEEQFSDVNTAAVTIATTGSTTNGSPNITGLPSTVGILNGFAVAGAGIPTGATVLAVTDLMVVISLNATATGNGVALTFSGA